MKRNALLVVLALLVFFVLPPGSLRAGVNVWTTNGPDGGDIRALAIDPANPATLYAGTSGGGVFKSTNGGGSWNAVNTGLTSTLVIALAIDPSAPDTLYAGTGGAGVFKSSNGGESWSATNTGLTNTYVRTLAIDPITPATIYAGTEGGGVFKSTNGGGSWTAINAGLVNSHVNALAIDPSAPDTLYAGTSYSAGEDVGVYKSRNGGGSWTLTIYVGGVTEVSALAIDPSAPSNIYAGLSTELSVGVIKSTDGGASWTDSLFSSGVSVFALVIDSSASAALYAGTDRGVFKSTNGGGSWTGIGLTKPGVAALAIERVGVWDYWRLQEQQRRRELGEGALYAGTWGAGVFKSTDGGGSWTAINARLSNTDVRALAIDPSAPATLYAGTWGGGVFKSSNGGGSWTAVNTGLTDPFVSALAIDPSAPATLYAGIASGFSGGVFKSTNGGASWTAINVGLSALALEIGALAIDPSTPATLYAGTGGGVFKSTDGGGSWTAVNSGLTDDYHSIYALAIDPSAPATLYALTNGGIFKSTNGGGNWTESFVGRFFSALAIDPSTPAALYATSLGIFKSIDGGESWAQINAGLTDGLVTSLVIDPSAPATLYAGTERGGVYKSMDGGGNWTPINAGLTNLNVHALAIDPSMPTRLYTGTDGGVYEVDDYLAEPCLPGPTTLCLSGGRFKVTTRWTTRDGQTGAGQAVALAGGDAGYFTFFNPGNVEVAVKVLNGCGLNAHFWTFAAGLTDVSVVMTVSDSQTGEVKTYTNPQGTAFQPIQDTSAFATCAAGATGGARPYDGSAGGWLIPPSVISSFDERAKESCVPNATTLCLSDSRYQVRAQWVAQDGRNGAGQVINLTGDAGAFWFFSPSNVEVVIKVLNACGLNSRYWTFVGGLTDVNVILTVTDTQTGTIQTYTNPQGSAFQPIQDTNAFATCP